MTLRPLDRLRLRLTAWYVGTFLAIIALLGAGLFAVIRHQISAQLDASLRAAAQEVVRAARIRETESAASHGTAVDAVDELRIPDRTLYLLDGGGRPVRPDHADPWIRAAALRAARSGSADVARDAGGETTLRLHAERFALGDGTRLVAAAVADQVELEDQYAALIAAFGAAALFALVLVAVGGWLLVRQSTRPVERSFEYMRRFMADAAHELRTPLTVLRSRAEVALQQPRNTAAYVSALRGIDAESQRLGRIVEDLLTLARADAGERPIARARVYLDDVALDAAGAARVVAQAKGVGLTLDEFEEAVVAGDATLLRQLVMILLDNAVKFTPAGGAVRVRVGSAGGRASLVVDDTGVGIGPAQLPHVFERFYRGDPARARSGAEGGGAGLGLSIAQWIVDAHDAELTLTSAEGRGTTVTVVFPAVTVRASDGDGGDDASSSPASSDHRPAARSVPGSLSSP